MAGKPAESPRSGRSQILRSGEAGEHQRPRERVWDLTIARHIKDDGRALILYVREQGEQM